MKTVYHLYVCGDEGEYDAMFSDTGELIAFWSLNDASWREEYFNGFMKAMGINIKRPSVTMAKTLSKILLKEIN